MEDHCFMVCRSCKKAEWWTQDEVPLFIEGHEGHSFTVLTQDTFEDQASFRKWFLKYMDWPVEEPT